jgi:hypothetical protein
MRQHRAQSAERRRNQETLGEYRMRRAANLLLILMVDAVAISVALAQSPGSQLQNSQQQLDIAAAKAQRKAVVSQNMYLTAAQARKFWPLYDAYERRMDRIEDRHIREIKNYVASYRNLTDTDANEKLDEVLAIQQARLQTQQEFVPKFRAVLPGVLVTRFFQIDSKMRAMVQCNIAQMVPLAQPPPSEERTGSGNY